MATAPSILYQNLLAEAADGRGDGTIYAWGTSATVDQANKQFDLTTVNIMTDLGADADDKFNGYVLVFTSSGRSYLITDWVAATDLATVFETPNTTDTGAWTIRRTLYTNDFAAANPIRYAANGRLYQKWTDASANNAANIYAALPNGVDDGGFEKNSLTDYWTASENGDGAVTINSTSPILGTYDCKLDMGTTGTSVGIIQAGKIDLKAGRTYGIIFKAYREIAETANKLFVFLNYTAPSGTTIPVVFTKINSGDTITSLVWYPVLSTTAAWKEIIFTVSEDVDAGDYRLYLTNIDSTNRYDVYLDEIYLWEIGPTVSGVDQPDTLIIGNHNHAGGYAATSYLRGNKCPSDITNFGVGAGDTTTTHLVDLDASVTVDGNSPVYETWTAETSIWPIHEIQLAAISGKTWEAGEIWVGKRWDWDRFVANKWTPHDGNIEVNATASFGGVEVITERYRKRRMAGRLPLIDDAAFTAWKQFIAEVGVGGAFWYYMQALTDPVTEEEIMLMRNAIRPVIRSDMAGNLSVDNFSFIEMF